MGWALTALFVIGYGWRTVTRNADWRNEETLFRAAVAVSPRSAMAQKNLGGALLNSSRSEEAIPHYQRALKFLDDFPQAHYELGNCLFNKKPQDLAGAEREYRIALKQSPKHASAHQNLGATLHVQERYEAALREFEAALKISPNLDLALFNRVHTLLALERIEAAKRALDQAIGRFPNSPQIPELRLKIEQALLPSGR